MPIRVQSWRNTIDFIVGGPPRRDGVQSAPGVLLGAQDSAPQPLHTARHSATHTPNHQPTHMRRIGNRAKTQHGDHP